MKNYTVVVWYPQGLRVYEVRGNGPVSAVQAAREQDAVDYSDNPADWHPATAQFEVMRGHQLTEWRN
jgi:hypothetical protein